MKRFLNYLGGKIAGRSGGLGNGNCGAEEIKEVT